VDRLFLDANVLFTAAHRPEGKAGFLIQAAESATGEPPWKLLSSAYAIEEARRNLAVKIPSAVDSLDVALRRVRVVAQPPAALLTLDALPAKDIPIWSAAHAAQATHLLTGDLRDFGPFMNRPQQTGGVILQTVGQYLAAWRSR
jgi:hypothetical protein